MTRLLLVNAIVLVSLGLACERAPKGSQSAPPTALSASPPLVNSPPPVRPPPNFREKIAMRVDVAKKFEVARRNIVQGLGFRDDPDSCVAPPPLDTSAIKSGEQPGGVGEPDPVRPTQA